jgi:D-glycero-D-manno-heptose 1,7-bisphosphate phosphatase
MKRSGSGGRKAIFLDRDGTLLVEVGYLNHPSQVMPYHFTVEALRLARKAGYLLILVTNQSGIARGYLSEAELETIHDKMQALLEEGGAGLDAVFYCPHHKNGSVNEYAVKCSCRKPGIELGLRAARRFNIDLEASFMIGDKKTDLEFGRALGVTPCLVRTGFGTFEEKSLGPAGFEGARIFDNLLDSVRYITTRRTGQDL